MERFAASARALFQSVRCSAPRSEICFDASLWHINDLATELGGLPLSAANDALSHSGLDFSRFFSRQCLARSVEEMATKMEQTMQWPRGAISLIPRICTRAFHAIPSFG